MNVTYTDEVKRSADDYQLLRKVSERLPDVVGKSDEPVTAEWDRRADEKGQTVFTLRFQDPIGEVIGKITPDELRSPGQTAFRLYHLWGKLLQKRNEYYFNRWKGD